MMLTGTSLIITCTKRVLVLPKLLDTKSVVHACLKGLILLVHFYQRCDLTCGQKMDC